MIIQSKRVWVNGRFMEAQVVVENQKVVRILEYGSKAVDKDYGNLRIVPGFIDIHTHGAYGFDTNHADETGLRNWVKNIPHEGVTSILPTTITENKTILQSALENVRDVVEKGYEGAEIIGIHLEGPFISQAYHGGQPDEFIAKPNVEQFKKYQNYANGLIKIITLASEEDDDFALTRYCHENGVVVTLGHTAANFEQMSMAFANGAESITHVFNATSPIHHRELGGSGASLRYSSVYSDIICDACHISVDTLNYFFKIKGRDYGIMISDSLALKGLPVGTCEKAGSNTVELFADGSARIKGTTRFAGSTLKINEGLKILVERAMVPFETALNSCTINPARLLKIDDRKGKIMVGYDADFVVLNDDYTVNMTYVKGKEAF